MLVGGATPGLAGDILTLAPLLPAVVTPRWHFKLQRRGWEQPEGWGTGGHLEKNGEGPAYLAAR